MENRELLTYEFLNNLKIDFKKYSHQPIMTIEESKQLDEKMGLKISKNLFLSTKSSKEFYLLLMNGEKKFDTGKVSKQLNIPRLTFGNSDFLLEYLDIYPGSVSPLGLIHDRKLKVNFLIDKEIVDTQENIALHPCVNTSTLLLSVKDLVGKIIPKTNHNIQVVEV